MVDYSDIVKKTAICSLCGVILAASARSFVCQNPNCPDYLLEKHEHLPERYVNFDNLKIDVVSLSGTAASGVSGTYGPIRFIEWPLRGSENND